MERRVFGSPSTGRPDTGQLGGTEGGGPDGAGLGRYGMPATNPHHTGLHDLV